MRDQWGTYRAHKAEGHGLHEQVLHLAARTTPSPPMHAGSACALRGVPL